MQMVGADWIKSDKREDDLAGRPGGLVQVSYAKASSLVSPERMKVFTNSFYCRNVQHKGAPNSSSL